MPEITPHPAEVRAAETIGNHLRGCADEQDGDASPTNLARLIARHTRVGELINMIRLMIDYNVNHAMREQARKLLAEMEKP